MNADQIASHVRSVLKMLGLFLTIVGHTQWASAITDPELAAAISDAVGPLMIAGGFLWSHFHHSDGPAIPPGAKAAMLLLFGSLVCFSGCKSTPQTAAYQAAGITAVTVETALKAYDAFAATGHTNPAQNQEVKAAYVKYQAAFAVLCDAGAVYAATSSTNAPAASAAFQEAASAASQDLSDLVFLLRSFGVSI